MALKCTLDDDFDAFRVALEANLLADIRVLVVPRDGTPQPTPLASKPTTSSILPEMPPPTKKRRESARLQEALAHTTESKSGATTTISTNKEAHAELDKVVALAQTLVPPPAATQTVTQYQQPKASKLKLKPKKVHLISCMWIDFAFHPFVLRMSPKRPHLMG